MNNIEEKSNKRNEIISTAERFFYEKGYKNTYVEQVAKAINVTAPLINYHFRSKDNLAKAVMEKILTDIKNKLSEKIYLLGIPHDQKTSTVVDILTYSKMWNEDIKAQRFYLDFMNCGFETCFMNTIYNFYKMHDRQYHLKIDRMSGELSMLATAASFGYFSLQYAFFTGKLDCKTYEQFSDYAIRMQFRFMNFTEDEIDEIMDRGTQVYNMLDINIEPYFTIS